MSLAMRELPAHLAAPNRSQTREMRRRPAPRRYPMLGLSGRSRQADADLEIYNFSLDTSNSSVFSGRWRPFPEMTICEQHPLDAHDGMADRCAIFPLRGQMGWPR